LTPDAAATGPGPDAGRFAVFCSAVLCAPTTLQVIITGQYSWLYLMALSGLAAYGSRGDDRRAGRSLALLALKPNLALVVLPLLVLRRRWSTLRAAAYNVFVVVVVTAPFSVFAWEQFLVAARGVAQRQGQGDAPIDKQTTVLAFLHVVTGRMDGSVLVWVVWLAVVAAVGALVVWAWRVAGPETSELRLVGMAALSIVSLSPRLYFYDGLVVVVAAAHWYLCRSRYHSRLIRRTEGACMALIVVVTFLFFPWPGVATLFGPLAALWLALEAADILLAERAASRVSIPRPEHLALTADAA
jgi:hypothetical protein